MTIKIQINDHRPDAVIEVRRVNPMLGYDPGDNDVLPYEYVVWERNALGDLINTRTPGGTVHHRYGDGAPSLAARVLHAMYPKATNDRDPHP